MSDVDITSSDGLSIGGAARTVEPGDDFHSDVGATVLASENSIATGEDTSATSDVTARSNVGRGQTLRSSGFKCSLIREAARKTNGPEEADGIVRHGTRTNNRGRSALTRSPQRTHFGQDRGG